MNQALREKLDEYDADAMKIVIIEDEGCDPRLLAEIAVDDPDHEDKTVILTLLQDSEPHRETDRTFEMQSGEARQQMVTGDRWGGVALYISMLETHGFDEDWVEESFSQEDSPIDLSEYHAWRNSLSLRDRRIRLINQAEERIEHGGENVEAYFDAGAEFRETGLSDGAVRTASRILSRIDPNPRRCYENAYRAVTGYDGSRDVTYVEGIALPKNPGRIATHAWIEIDGAVAEVTWPWHSPSPPSETVYFGVEVPQDELTERFKERPGSSNPIVPDIDVLERIIRSSDSP